MSIVITNPTEGGGPGSTPVVGSPTAEAANKANLNLREGNNISVRPVVLTSRHLYNLRNQGWSVPRPTFTGGDSASDLITQFHNINPALFPANADVPTPYIYQNTATEAGSKYIQRFNAGDCYTDQKGNTQPPVGYFIIDALDRGASRETAYAQMMGLNPSNSWNISDLPTDETPSGATVVAEYSGRVFYGGYTGVLNGGDSSSPRMSSYVLFSALVQDPSDFYQCYQSGDPTSDVNNDLLDTDGGFLRIDGAYNINAMANIQSGLVVFGENGAWVIQGGNQNGFTATNYKVTKVTDNGCVAPNSVVIVNNSVIYWSKDGIYNLSTNTYGDYVADNITRKTIQTFYNNLDASDQKAACGTYDEYEQKVKWVIGNRQGSVAPTLELSLDMTLGAYSKYTINRLFSNSRYPWLVRGVQTDPFAISSNLEDVIVTSGDQAIVTSGATVEVFKNSEIEVSNIREVKYLVLVDNQNPNICFTFGNYINDNHYDWTSADTVNGTGIDARSFLLTGVLAGGDYQRKKGVVYLTAHLSKTEDGLVDDGTGSGDLTLKNPSSCIMQGQWDFTNSANSNKWTNKQEIYRLRRAYYPTDNSNFDNGFYVVETRNKIRGSGKVLSILFESTPGYHCDLLGWSMTLGTNGNV